MKYQALAALTALILAGCNGTARDREAIMDFCENEVGMEEAECSCLTDAAEENLDDELFGKFAEVARNGGDRDGLMEELSPSEQQQLFGFIAQSATSCAFGQE